MYSISSIQARLQRANTLLRLGKLGEAAKDFEFLAESASGSVKEDAIVQVSGELGGWLVTIVNYITFPKDYDVCPPGNPDQPAESAKQYIYDMQ